MRIVIADDHPVILMGLRTLLQEHTEGHEVVGEASHGAMLFAILARCSCDLLITDFSMPLGGDSVDGLVLVRQLREQHPKLPIIILTMLSNIALIRGMLSAGINAVVEKTSLIDELIFAIQVVKEGRTYVSERLRGKLMDGGASGEVYSTGNDDLNSSLSPCEAEVLRMLACGLTVSDIAHSTGRSIKTVSQQKHDAMRKLDIDSESELFEYMRLNGLWCS